MYSTRQIGRGLANPRLVLKQGLKQVRAGYTYYQRSVRGRTGVQVMDEDWDTLIILDGCRYDLFSEEQPLDGRLESRISAGSSTKEFLHANFEGRSCPDTVYVSANPQLERWDMCHRFHDTAELWKSEWNDEHNTVFPDSVTDRAIEAHEQHPNKRLIVHYIQPHYPFIGKTGASIDQEGLSDDEYDKIWIQLKNGTVEAETVWQAYRENLELVIPHVSELLSAIEGKTVVTSDHGNAMGRLGAYGHPHGTYLESLVRVPWLVVEDNERRTIEAGGTQDRAADKDVDEIKERLENLGYR